MQTTDRVLVSADPKFGLGGENETKSTPDADCGSAGLMSARSEEEFWGRGRHQEWRAIGIM
jgi:hypothetical protein